MYEEKMTGQDKFNCSFCSFRAEKSFVNIRYKEYMLYIGVQLTLHLLFGIAETFVSVNAKQSSDGRNFDFFRHSVFFNFTTSSVAVRV